MQVSMEGQVRSAPECALMVVRDIYYLKRLAIETICQLALDTISNTPTDRLLSSQLIEQVEEEFDHFHKCRLYLADRDGFGTEPGYVRHFARIMRSYGSKRRRTLPLAVAAILCIAVERSAMQQLTRASTSDRELAELLRKLNLDEENHYKLVSQVVAPCASSRASLFEWMWAYLMISQVTLVTLLRWWPRRVAEYESIGLRADVFVEDVVEYAAQALRPLGFFLPEGFLLRLARMAVKAT